MARLEGLSTRQLKFMSRHPLISEMRKIYGRPSLEELLENQFFSNAIGSISKDSNGRKQHLKFSASTKESLAKHKSDFESRLLEDHKKVMINNLRYLCTALEFPILSSEFPRILNQSERILLASFIKIDKKES